MGSGLVRVMVLLVSVAALMFAGCGSDDEGTEAAAEPLTHEQLVEQATATCDETQSRMEELSQELGDAGVFDPESAPLVEEVAAATDQLVSNLQALEPPAEDAEDYERLVGLIEDGSEKLSEIAVAAADGDRETARSLQEEINATGDEIGQLGTDLGLAGCVDA